MRKILSLAFLTILVAGFVGCGKKTEVQAQGDPKAFDSASAELKAVWQKVSAAAQSKDYTTAILTCRQLQNITSLTPEQRTLVNQTMTDVSNQMSAAAEKGDQAALNAVQEIRKQWR